MKTVKNRLKRKRRLQRRTKKKLRGGGIYTLSSGDNWYVCDNPFCYQQYNKDPDTPGILTLTTESDKGTHYIIMTLKSDTSKKYYFKYKIITEDNNNFFYLGKTETEKYIEDSKYTYEFNSESTNERLPLNYGENKNIKSTDIPNLEPLLQKLFALIDACPGEIEEVNKGTIIAELVNSTGRYVSNKEDQLWGSYENNPVHKTLEDLENSIRKLDAESIDKLNKDLFKIYKFRGNILCYKNRTTANTTITGPLRNNVDTTVIPVNPTNNYLLLVPKNTGTWPNSTVDISTKKDNDKGLLYLIILADLAINGIHKISIDGGSINYEQIKTENIYKSDWLNDESELPTETEIIERDKVNTEFLSDTTSSLEDILSRIYRSDLSLNGINISSDNKSYIDKFKSDILNNISSNFYFKTKCKLLGLEKLDLSASIKEEAVNHTSNNAFNMHLYETLYYDYITDTSNNNHTHYSNTMKNLIVTDKREITHLCPKCLPIIKKINPPTADHMNTTQDNKSKQILDKILNLGGCEKYTAKEVQLVSEDVLEGNERGIQSLESMGGMDKFIDLIKEQSLSQERNIATILAARSTKSSTSLPDVPIIDKLDPEHMLMKKFEETEKLIHGIRGEIDKIREGISTITNSTNTTWEREVKARGQQIDEMKKELSDFSEQLKDKKKITPSKWSRVK